jgi:hypothetical protein
MGKSILPDDARERRRRVRLCALRAMDRLGLLGEGSLIPTLDRRPELRWLADEEGARWAVLAQLGRIGKPEVFEEAVEWTLQNRPRPEEAGAYVRLLRSGALPSTGTGGLGGVSTAQQAAPSVPRLHRATGRKIERRC